MTANEIKAILSSNDVLTKIRAFDSSGITGVVKGRTGYWVHAGGCGLHVTPVYTSADSNSCPQLTSVNVAEAVTCP